MTLEQLKKKARLFKSYQTNINTMEKEQRISFGRGMSTEKKPSCIIIEKVEWKSEYQFVVRLGGVNVVDTILTPEQFEELRNLL